MQLTSGKVPWTDTAGEGRVRPVGQAHQPGYVTANSAALDWQDAAPLLVQGKAATYLMGNFAVATFKQGGMKERQPGLLRLPRDHPGHSAGRGSADRHLPRRRQGAKHPEKAKKFLAFVASAKVQTKVNEILGQLPMNNQSSVGDDPFLQQGFKMLSTASGMAQFFDRDAPAQWPRRGWRASRNSWRYPDQLDAILARLEQVRQQRLSLIRPDHRGGPTGPSACRFRLPRAGHGAAPRRPETCR